MKAYITLLLFFFTCQMVSQTQDKTSERKKVTKAAFEKAKVIEDILDIPASCKVLNYEFTISAGKISNITGKGNELTPELKFTYKKALEKSVVYIALVMSCPEKKTSNVAIIAVSKLD